MIRDGSEPAYATSTIESERINPADENRLKIPKKRENSENGKKLPDGAKGPKFTKKSIDREQNRRNASQFGNLTDY